MEKEDRVAVDKEGTDELKEGKELPEKRAREALSELPGIDNNSKGKAGREKESNDLLQEKKRKKEEDVRIEKTLWTVAKKYKELFDRGGVPQIAESEADRQQVAEAYKLLITERHRQLDTRVYQSLTKMQRIRDSKTVLEGSTEKDRLKMIAWEVKTRLQPVVFLGGDSSLSFDIFGLPERGEVKIIEGDKRELLVEDEIIPGQGVAIIETLRLRELSPERIARLRRELLINLSGKTFSREKLEKELSSLYADLLSLMVREREILLLKRDNTIEILSGASISQQLANQELESQSLVITPKKGTKAAKK